MIPNWVTELLTYFMRKKTSVCLHINLVNGGFASIDEVNVAHEHWTQKRWEVERSGLS